METPELAVDRCGVCVQPGRAEMPACFHTTTICRHRSPSPRALSHPPQSSPAHHPDTRTLVRTAFACQALIWVVGTVPGALHTRGCQLGRSSSRPGLLARAVGSISDCCSVQLVPTSPEGSCHSITAVQVANMGLSARALCLPRCHSGTPVFLATAVCLSDEAEPAQTSHAAVTATPVEPKRSIYYSLLLEVSALSHPGPTVCS
ncbi:hypothetical protein B0H63DRAFT_206638 [Podospora didyma]|uniref:Uncharacterized protein n=1 Tax=Podospora didyma TaxID=330526 RepID=A0AAE0NHC4_9PEZI|nr:hypothetical protein B0H63DRAFT_206638 [Podospora didyma]